MYAVYTCIHTCMHCMHTWEKEKMVLTSMFWPVCFDQYVLTSIRSKKITYRHTITHKYSAEGHTKMAWSFFDQRHTYSAAYFSYKVRRFNRLFALLFLQHHKHSAAYACYKVRRFYLSFYRLFLTRTIRIVQYISAIRYVGFTCLFIVFFDQRHTHSAVYLRL